MNISTNRREMIRITAASGLVLPYLRTGRTMADETKTANSRPRIGSIGVGSMGSGDSSAAARFGDIVAVCDVDKSHAEKAKNSDRIGKGKADAYEDYRKVLDRKDIDIVTISTPDHWHSKILIEAMKAGKDAYCQKPLTLTIDEGKKILQVQKETGRVVQVGTQQRSENNNMFLLAAAMVRDGRLGTMKKVTCSIGGAPKGGPFKTEAVPAGLNWDMWQGQTMPTDYIKERCHYEFRWWYEYSGGKMTDWGAHHVDEAMWALGLDNSGVSKVEVVKAIHPVPYAKGYTTDKSSYNVATNFHVKCTCPGDVELNITDEGENGITFIGSTGSIFVSRGEIILKGTTVDALYKKPVSEDLLMKMRNGKRFDSHMGNFMECVRDRGKPISDVGSHHRAMTTCHLGNIAMRLGRTLTWDAAKEEIVGDAEANAWQSREQRKGFEVTA